MWNDTAISRRLDIRYPIVQGPFGGGLSSARLVATVSNAGGLGSFGAQGMPPDRIRDAVARAGIALEDSADGTHWSIDG